MITKQQITGLILAGGQGSRMGGVDKGWVNYQGAPLIQHAISALAPQVTELCISANRELARYQQLGYIVVEDIIKDFAGPLAGIHAGLAQASTDWVATIPVDSPHISQDLVAKLVACQQQTEAEVIFASDGEFPQPVFLLLQKSLLASLATQLNSGDGKIMRWVKQQKHAECVFTDKRLFENKNSPDDLKV
jgi:molybdopterin-guanine dinucleotide biosynthesis protein A